MARVCLSPARGCELQSGVARPRSSVPQLWHHVATQQVLHKHPLDKQLTRGLTPCTPTNNISAKRTQLIKTGKTTRYVLRCHLVQESDASPQFSPKTNVRNPARPFRGETRPRPARSGCSAQRGWRRRAAPRRARSQTLSVLLAKMQKCSAVGLPTPGSGPPFPLRPQPPRPSPRRSRRHQPSSASTLRDCPHSRRSTPAVLSHTWFTKAIGEVAGT